MLNKQQQRILKTRAHDLKPVVIIGNQGLSDAVLLELTQAIAHHELIKVRVNAADRDEREKFTTTICEQLDAELVQQIGHIVVLYKANPDAPKIDLNVR